MVRLGENSHWLHCLRDGTETEHTRWTFCWSDRSTLIGIVCYETETRTARFSIVTVTTYMAEGPRAKNEGFCLGSVLFFAFVENSRSTSRKEGVLTLFWQVEHILKFSATKSLNEWLRIGRGGLDRTRRGDVVHDDSKALESRSNHDDHWGPLSAWRYVRPRRRPQNIPYYCWLEFFTSSTHSFSLSEELCVLLFGRCLLKYHSAPENVLGDAWISRLGQRYMSLAAPFESAISGVT